MNEPVTIPEEAVEELSKSLIGPAWGSFDEGLRNTLREIHRDALVAAAPAILAAERERIAAGSDDAAMVEVMKTIDIARAAERERIADAAELMADELGWDGLTGELHEVRDYVKGLLHRLAAIARGES